MQLHLIDYSIFAAFVVTVVAIGILGSRHEKDSESYFLAGRGLPWWLIGFSLIAANISTEQFVGMSGSAADRLGMAIASYEWLAAITLVVVAFFFLPYFLRTDPFLPWTTLVLGLWIPNFYYWGLNQYIMQRTLGSQSLAQGQKGIVFAALMKLIIPFIIVMPGMIAFNLFSDNMRTAARPENERVLKIYQEAKAAPAAARTVFIPDEAWQKANPAFATEMTAINEAVISRGKSDGFKPTEERLVGMGRILVGVFTVLGCSLAPKPGDPRIGNSIFAIIQEGQA